MRALRLVVAAFGFIGGAMFAAAFVVSYVNPGWVEHQARLAIQAEVQERVQAQVDLMDGGHLADIARRLAGRHREEAAAMRRQLEEGLPAKVAAIVTQMQDLDCTCRQQVERNLTGWLESGIRMKEGLQARFEALVRTKYMEVAGKILREFRIFTGVNAAVLLFLGLAVVLRRKAGLHLVPAAGVLFVASALVAHAYLFKQDWLHTIVFNDYVGLWYLGYVGIAAVLLGDLLFNRARITARLLNVVLNAVGSALSVVPC